MNIRIVPLSVIAFSALFATNSVGSERSEELASALTIAKSGELTNDPWRLAGAIGVFLANGNRSVQQPFPSEMQNIVIVDHFVEELLNRIRFLARGNPQIKNYLKNLSDENLAANEEFIALKITSSAEASIKIDPDQLLFDRVFISVARGSNIFVSFIDADGSTLCEFSGPISSVECTNAEVRAIEFANPGSQTVTLLLGFD